MPKAFISPFYPFLDEAANDDGQDFCEHVVNFHSACAHTSRQTRCHSAPNLARAQAHARQHRLPVPDHLVLPCTPACIPAPLYTRYLFRDLCARCAPLAARDRHAAFSAAELAARDADYDARARACIPVFRELVRRASRFDLAGSEPDELFDHPEWVDAAHTVDPYSDGAGDDGGAAGAEEEEAPEADWAALDLGAPRPSTLAREAWYARHAGIRDDQGALGVAVGRRWFYVPGRRADETDLLVPAGALPGDEVCGICRAEYGEDRGGDWRRMPCGHVYHYDEIRKWLRYRTCPACRQAYQLRRVPNFAKAVTSRRKRG